ncbi:hypothetical protein ACR2WW_24635, partial [Klebsiella pneumoniae]
INGSLELVHFISSLWIDKTFWLHHIQLFFNKSINDSGSNNNSNGNSDSNDFCSKSNSNSSSSDLAETI